MRVETIPTAPVGDDTAVGFTERPMVYVAGFYTANPAHGIFNAAQAFDALVEKGWQPIVPHINILLDAIHPRTPDFWYEYDLGLLERCDAMYVCPDYNTNHSAGVFREIEFCVKRDIPVLYEVIEASERYDY